MFFFRTQAKATEAMEATRVSFYTKINDDTKRRVSRTYNN